MQTIQDNACDCQMAVKGSNSKTDEACTSCNDEQYACNKFSDPDWIQKNIEYFPAGFESPDGEFKNIPPKEAYILLRHSINEEKTLVLDVKTEQEYHQKHLSGSLNLDFFSSKFKDDLFNLDKEKCYVVICKIGMRSEIAMNIMKKMGFKQVYNVIGGDDRWLSEGIPYKQELHCDA